MTANNEWRRRESNSAPSLAESAVESSELLGSAEQTALRRRSSQSFGEVLERPAQTLQRPDGAHPENAADCENCREAMAAPLAQCGARPMNPHGTWWVAWPCTWWLRDAIFQHSRVLRKERSGVASAVAAEIIVRGGGYARLPVGVKPRQDKDMAWNEAVLRERLPRILHPDGYPLSFEIDLWGEMEDEDGSLVCGQSLRCEQFGPDAKPFSLKAGMWIPVEVGQTHAETTNKHLNLSGAVARWPYGHTHVTILAAKGGVPLIHRFMEQIHSMRKTVTS